MTSQGQTVTILLLVGLAVAAGLARQPEFGEFRAVQESLSGVHPRMRARWLRERGLDDSYYTTFRKPDSQGLRCIGRWPWGPSWETCGQESLLFLGSGSGVRILSITDSVHPRMVGQVNARGLINQLVVQDSLLFVACGNWGAQVYSISDPANPQELGSMDAVIGDLTVKDTLCYTLGGDSFRIYNVADPTQPEQLSALRDSGDVIAVTNGHAFVAGNVRNMNVYDVLNPTAPQWVNSRGGLYFAFFARGELLLCTDPQPSYFSILDVSDPLAIPEVGRLDGYGGRALYADDYFAYLSCSYEHNGLHIIDISDSTNPRHRGSIDPEGNSEYDPYVPVPLSYAYLANYDAGLVTIDIHDVNSPTEAGKDFKAHSAVDVHIDGSKAYVADTEGGLYILDVSNPTEPTTLGQHGLYGQREVVAATARDSFAFISIWVPGRKFLRVLDVSDPTNPVFAAEESCRNAPKDLVLRDTLVYAAEDLQFQVFNVARPREPELVGSCELEDDAAGMWLQESLAYVAYWPVSIINIADPLNPVVVGEIRQGCSNVVVNDTVAFLSSGMLVWYSVADPTTPYPIDSIGLGHTARGLAVVDTIVYVSALSNLYAVNVSDLHQPSIVASARLPYAAKRITYAEPYLYVSCWDAGFASSKPLRLASRNPRNHPGLEVASA